MSEKNVNFNDNEIRKSYFFKNKKINIIEEFDTNKILVSKKESYDTKSHLNSLLDIMIMLLDHYV